MLGMDDRRIDADHCVNLHAKLAIITSSFLEIDATVGLLGTIQVRPTVVVLCAICAGLFILLPKELWCPDCRSPFGPRPFPLDLETRPC